MNSQREMTYGQRIDQVRSLVEREQSFDDKDVADLLNELRSLAEQRAFVSGLDGLALSAADGLYSNIKYLESLREAK